MAMCRWPAPVKLRGQSECSPGPRRLRQSAWRSKEAAHRGFVLSSSSDGEIRRVYRSGVRFNCPQCGLLYRDDTEHSEVISNKCMRCGHGLKLVARGENRTLVGDACWFRCTGCRQLYMRRRGSVVVTGPRSGFAEYT